MFDNATSPEACALAAKSYAESPSRFLAGLLDDLPAQVPFVALCEHLISELTSAGMQDALTWTELLEAISRESSENDRAMPEEAIDLLQRCARSLAALKVSHVDVWSKLIAGVPEGIRGGPILQTMARIARDMEHSGIEQEVLWKSLIELFADPRSRNMEYADVATALKYAGVSSAVAWRVLHDVMTRDAPVPGYGRTSFYRTLFSPNPAPLDMLELMRQFGASSLISNCKATDLAVWKRVIDAASQVGALVDAAEACAKVEPAKGVWAHLLSAFQEVVWVDASGLPDLVRICSKLRFAEVWRHLLPVIQSAHSTEGINLLSVCKIVFDATSDPDWGELVRPCIHLAATRAREGARQKICYLVQLYLEEFVETLGVPGACVLLKPVIRLVLGEDIEPSAAFRKIDPKNACNILLILETSVPGAQRAAYRSMLENALRNGTLGLDSIEAVHAHRDLLRKSAPSIEWTAIFHPKANKFPTRKFYSSFPELQTNVDAFLISLKVLVLEIGAYNSALHKNKVALDAPERVALRAVADGLIGMVTGLKTKVPMYQLWGKKGEKNIQIDQALLSRLIGDGAVNAAVASEVEQAESALALIAGSELLVQKAAAMRKCWGGLTDCVNAPGFAELYDLCGNYEVAMLDPDDVANLKVGYEVSCCLAPDGDQAHHLFPRLAGGWIMWAVKNKQGQTAAIAWGALNREGELVIDFIDERVNFRMPPLGNNLVEQLILFAPHVAKAVKAQAVWLAPPGYGRLEKFPAFVDRPKEPKSFEILVADFLGVKMYTDSLNEGAAQYSRLM